MEVKLSSSGIFIDQMKYVDDSLINLFMKYYKPIVTQKIIDCKLRKEDSFPLVDATLYMYHVGSLIYMIATRPNIIFVIV